ncbi:uncharacterized transporter slc-17.2-like [Argonauta hians]
MTRFRDFTEKYTSCRWRLCYASFFALLLMQTLRVNLSMSFVCMLKPANHTVEVDQVRLDVNDDLCSNSENISSNGKQFTGEFQWSNSLQSNILAGYFYGYVISNLIGGILADKYGGKRVMGVAILSASILTLLQPSMTRISGYFTLVLRILTGIMSGPMGPCIQSLLGRWAPPLENSALLAFCFSGLLFGSITGMSVSGFLCVYGFDNGWGSIFYVFGGVSLLFSFVWFYVVYDSPEVHPNISEKEKSYLKDVIICRNQVKNIPWREIITSPAVWALIISHTCYNWTIMSFQVVLPLYMKEALNINPKSNGFMSSAPFVGQFITVHLWSRLADFFRTKHILSTRSVRVLFQSICFLGSASLLVAIGFLNCNQASLAGILFLFTGMFLAFYIGGFNANHIDVAPRYAGILFGISNTFGSFPGSLVPIFAKALTPNGTQSEWQIVLALCAAFSVFGTIMFAILASGEVQKWAISDDIPNSVPLVNVESQKRNKVY